MKIAYLVNQYPKVSHTFIRREIKELETLGFVVHRMSIRPPDGDYIDIEDQKEKEITSSILHQGGGTLLMCLIITTLIRPVRCLRALKLAWRLGGKSERGILVHFIYLAEAAWLCRWLQQHDVVHLHAHFGTNSTAVALFCKLLGGPSYSFTSHGPEEYDKPQSIGLTEKINHAAFVAGISSFGRSQLFRWCATDQWGKIKVIRCGLGAEDIDSPATPIKDEKVLVCVGRLCEQKGQELLVQAASEVIKRGIEFKLILVGDGEKRKDVEAMIARLNLHNHVEIRGWMSGKNVKQALINSRGLVLPSFAEGLPVVIMESFAIGRPVISTYIAGIPELVIDKVNGWLCPASNIDSLVEAMEQMLNEPTQELQNMGLQGKQLVAQNHDARIEARKLKQFIEVAVAAQKSKD